MPDLINGVDQMYEVKFTTVGIVFINAVFSSKGIQCSSASCFVACRIYPDSFAHAQ